MSNWTPATIRELRAALGLSQTQFGARLGVTAATVARWESGNRVPNRYNELALARLRGDELALDMELATAYATADAPSRAAMDAVGHADRLGLSPLALALAGSAAIAAAYGETAAEWLATRTADRTRLEAAVSELIGAGLWPWR